MMHPSSRVQVTLSEEDSSGSDEGSEVSLEPETDRFGFILTNGSTAGVRSTGPPPEVVRQRETKWIHIIEQWDRLLLKKTSKVKVQCQKGIPASLRAKCWPLLCGATDRMKENKDLYKSLDSQPALQIWVDVIERDLDRQFPFHEMFLSKDGHGQRGLFRVLKAYTQFQPEEGYCQAQGPVAAVLLMNMPAEEAFWCLVQISEQYLPGYYSPLLEGVLFDAAMLTWVLKRTCPSAHKHLQHYGVEPLMFATDWLMCLFTRHLPFNTLLRVWDLFFCYGVRVLLQVAAVLVRRVLGRTDQRKQCQGQMETLERLRSIRDEVQEEDDTFIAEVCSVSLSARDLQKQTEKVLQKWRKDKPSSTFDPRGRCHGYQMAWTRVQQNKEECERKEREKGNLSVPLARSASTLSLSPSLLRTRWRKAGKVNAGEWEGGGGGSKVVRHLSMAGKEDWQSWTDLNIKKEQGVQEENVEHKNQSDLKLQQQTEQKECLEETKSQRIPKPAETAAETIVNLQKEKVETTEPEKLENEPTVERTLQPEEAEHYSSVETDQTQSPAEGRSSDNQGEDVESDSQSQIPKELSHITEEQETESYNIKEAEKQKCESVMNENQTEINVNKEAGMQVGVDTSKKPTEQIDRSTEKPVHVYTKLQAITETSSGEESDDEAPVKDADDTVVTDIPQETEVDNPFEVKYQNTESLAELEIEEELHTQTDTETDVLAQIQYKVDNAATQSELETETDSKQDSIILQEDMGVEAETDSKQDSIILQEDMGVEAETDSKQDSIILQEDMGVEAETAEFSNECVQHKESPDVAEADTEILDPHETMTTNEVKDGICLTVRSKEEVDSGARSCDQTEAEEATERCVVADIAPPHNETLTQPKASENNGESRTSTSDEPDLPKNKASVCPAEKENKGNIEENPEVDDVFISNSSIPQSMDSLHTDTPQIQIKEDPLLVNDQIQIPGRRGSRSAGDFCVRKSPSSRGSRSARKLSEDLFTLPQKSNPGDINPTQSASNVIQSVESSGKTQQELSEMNEEMAAQKEPHNPPKRFGLFRRLRGEQPKKTPKVQVPKILIQDFSDVGTLGEVGEEKLSSRERRRRRRERERSEKEQEKLTKKKEKEMEKERDRKKPQTRGKSFQVQREKGSRDTPQPAANTGSQTHRYSTSYAESYF